MAGTVANKCRGSLAFLTRTISAPEFFTQCCYHKKVNQTVNEGLSERYATASQQLGWEYFYSILSLLKWDKIFLLNSLLTIYLGYLKKKKVLKRNKRWQQV